jgi:predicted ATP-binding protein involved in virulence
LSVSRNGQAGETVRDPDDFEKSTGRIPLLAIPDSRFVNRAIRGITPSSVPSRLSRNGARHFITQQPFENVILDLLAKLGLDYERNGTFEQPLFRLVERVVQELTEDEKFAFYSIERGEDTAFQILVKTAGNEDRPLPIQNASQGTLSVLAVFGLIYTFLQSLRPNVAPQSVTSGAGIILIDELDAHLHPRWQQKIMALLTGTFPNVQFIVSGHSPLLVAGCDQNEVAVLRRNPSADRFFLHPFEDDFLGSDPAELYPTVFDTEDFDRLFLEYSNKALNGSLETTKRDIERLEKKQSRSPTEESELDRLYQEKRLIQKAAKVRQQKLAAQREQSNVQVLKAEVERLTRILATERRKS